MILKVVSQRVDEYGELVDDRCAEEMYVRYFFLLMIVY